MNATAAGQQDQPSPKPGLAPRIEQTKPVQQEERGRLVVADKVVERYHQLYETFEIQNDDFIRALRNSAIVALVTTFLGVVVGSFCAYALARLKMRGKFILLGIGQGSNLAKGLVQQSGHDESIPQQKGPGKTGAFVSRNTRTDQRE